jgi:protein-S-isoprenylcysteine O-methyltransferase Ste14
MRFPKPYADIVQRFRVPGGFLILGAFLVLAQPANASILRGLPFCVAGLAIRAWAAGHLAKNEDLAQSGPYGHVRNPLYAGSLLLAGGMAIAANSLPMAAVFAAAFLLIYLPVIQLEEEHLRKLFPAYEHYARNVPSLFPRLTPWGVRKPFRFELYRRNQEWKALLGFLVGLGWLLLRR